MKNFNQFIFKHYRPLFCCGLFLIFFSIANSSFATKKNISLNKKCFNLIKQKQKQEDKVEALLTSERALQLSNSLKKQVLNIFENENLSLNEKLFQTFESYLKIRLSYLSSEEALRVKEIINENLVSDSYLDDIDVTLVRPYETIESYFYEGVIYIRTPTSYSQSLPYFYLSVHEIEHAIQHIVVGSEPYKVKHPKYYYTYRFLEEKGAMLAEASFSLAIPQDYLKSFLQNVSSHEALNQRDKKRFTNVIDSALNSSSPMDYVKNQWKKGYYSRKKMFYNQVFATSPYLARDLIYIIAAIDLFFNLK